MTLMPEQVAHFREKFEEVVSATISDESLTPEIIIDAVVQFKDLTLQFYNILRQMEPFGPDNMRPVFIAKNIKDSGWSRVVKDQHIKFSLEQDSIIFSGIGFNMAEKFYLLQDKKPVDVVFTLDENDWNNQKYLQLRVIDFRPAAEID